MASPQESQMAKISSNLDRAYSELFDSSWTGTKFEVDPLVDILEGTGTEEESARFFEATDKELKRVSEIYSNTAMSLKDSDDKGRVMNQRIIPRSMISFRVGRGYKVPSSIQNIYIQTVMCTQYAQLAREVLRALVELHDFKSGNSKGAEYIETVWTAGDDRGLFLHSALLRELEAIAIFMAAELGEENAAAIDPVQKLEWTHAQACDLATVSGKSPDQSWKSGSFAKTASFASEGRGLATLDEDEEGSAADSSGKDLTEGAKVPDHQLALMTCPVCLEFMYRPHGLSCGHCMCTPCLMSANKLANAVAPNLKGWEGCYWTDNESSNIHGLVLAVIDVALMSHLPYRNGKCAICRQLINHPPMELTALGRLVAKRAPEHYKACHNAFMNKQKDLTQKLEDQIVDDLGLGENPLAPVFKSFRDSIKKPFRTSSPSRQSDAGSREGSAHGGSEGGGSATNLNVAAA